MARRMEMLADFTSRENAMKKHNPSLLLLLSGLLIIHSFCLYGEDEFASMFETRYKEWRTWVDTHPLASTYTANDSFFAIVDLGVPAIPFIVSKIQENKYDFHLGSAIVLITKRKFDKDEWPEGKLGDSIALSEMYVDWWKVGRHTTEKRFEELLHEWHGSVSNGNANKARQILRKMSDLGIPVLPYLVVQLKENPELIPVFLYLSAAPLELSASAEACVQWWNENRANFDALWGVDQ